MGIHNYLKTYSGLDRSIYFLCLAQVVNSVGHFVHPFLTMFLTQKIGMDPVEAGTYVMLSAAARVPGSLLGGKIADQRMGAFSLLYLSHNIGFALGPMIAGFLFNRYLAWIFLGDALTTAAAVLLIALFIKEPAPSEDQIAKSFAEDQGLERAEKGSLLKVLLKRPSLVAFMFIHVEQRCSLFFTCWNNGPREARTRSRSRIQPLDFRNAI